MPVNRLGQTEFGSRIPFGITDEGDIDAREKKICNLASAEYYDDAVNMDDCLYLIEQYAADHDFLECEEQTHFKVVDFKGARAKNAAHPDDENDLVTMRYVRFLIQQKFDEVIAIVENMIGKKIENPLRSKNTNDPIVRQRLDEAISQLKSEVQKNAATQTEKESDINTDVPSEEF